jgi:phage shock protein C
MTKHKNTQETFPMNQSVRKLYRSNREKMVGGVCGGIAEYFNVDPTLVRLAFLAFSFVTGIGVGAYIVLWIVIPQEPSLDEGIVFDHKRKNNDE